MKFQAEFVVPAGCPLQVVRLELANPKRDADSAGAVAATMRGSLWFDDLAVRPLQFKEPAHH